LKSAVVVYLTRIRPNVDASDACMPTVAEPIHYEKTTKHWTLSADIKCELVAEVNLSL